MASSSPSERTLTRHRSASRTTPPAAIGMKATSTFAQVAVATLPSSQKTIAGRVVNGSARYVTRATRAEKNDAVTIPPRTTMRMWAPPRPEVMRKTMASASSPKPNDPPTRATGPRPSSRARAPPKEAPDETPMTSGLTRGLRNTACSAAPPIARPPPTSRASRTLGNLTSSTTFSSAAGRFDPKGTTREARISATWARDTL